MPITTPTALDRDELVGALADADLRVVLMCLFQITGDRRWLSAPYQPARDVRLIADEQAGLPDDVAAEIRAAAVDVLTSGPVDPAIVDPGDELMAEMMRWCTADRIDARYAPMFREDLGLVDRSVRWRTGRPDSIRTHTVIIGAGATGIILGKRLADLGVPFTIVERADEVGGTWRDNVYPGAAVDTPNHAYSYSTGSRYRWSRNFSPQPELFDYLRRSADEFGIRDRIRLSTEVIGGEWNDDEHTWRLDLRIRRPDGSVDTDHLVAHHLVAAIGPFGRAKLPDADGLDSFDGEVFHTTRWPVDADISGQRVAIVGTGASAMQIAPEIAPVVGHLTIVQRTPQWARPIPRFHDPITPGAQWLLEHVPFYAEWFRFTMLWRYGDGLLPHLRRDPDWPHPERSLNRVNERHRVEMHDHVVAELGDRTDLLEHCIPSYPPYGKRILLDNGWYRMLRRPNVSLVPGSLRRLEASGIVVAAPDGSESEIDVDVVVLSTGFEVNESVRVLNLVGRGGRTLDDLWDDDDATAHLGITIPHFPNLFVMLGPSTGLGHGGSAIFQAESQVRYVCDAIVTMIEQDLAALAVKESVHDEYVHAVDERHGQMIWTHPGVSTYYRNSKGRVVLATPWSLLEYWEMTHDVDLDDFEISSR
ncbi:MAG: flavin-containing monooxygenase [Ilumatobacteraceae bacterium]